jgi:homoserine dehydrogenase
VGSRGVGPAAKLTILANATLGYPARLEEIARAGVRSVSAAELQAARERGERYRLLAKASAAAMGRMRSR